LDGDIVDDGDEYDRCGGCDVVVVGGGGGGLEGECSVDVLADENRSATDDDDCVGIDWNGAPVDIFIDDDDAAAVGVRGIVGGGGGGGDIDPLEKIPRRGPAPLLLMLVMMFVEGCVGAKSEKGDLPRL
jgi:hypothetical protein